MKKKYLLTLIARRDVNGGYQYSNNIEQFEDNPRTGGHVRSHNFADEAELVRMVNAVLPNGENIKYRLGRLKTEGYYTIESVPPPILMTEEQAM